MVCLIGLAGLILTAPGRGQEPTKRAPPGPPGPLLPARDLVAYAEFDGIDAHPPAGRRPRRIGC